MSVPVLDLRGVAYAYPGGHQALFGVDLHVHPGERVALLGPNGAGKTTLVLHLNGILRAGCRAASPSRGCPSTDANLLEVRRRVGIVFQDPDDQLFMPTVRDDVAFGPANLGLRGAELEARVVEALDARRASATSPTGHRTTCPSASAGGWPSPPCWRCDPRSSCSTSRRRTSTRRRDASWPASCARSTSPCSWSPTTCRTRSSCASDRWCCREGTVVADGATREVLGDATLMARHRLELPVGFSI